MTADRTFDFVGKFPAVFSRSDEATGRIGAALARFVYPGLLVLLAGDLGTGKTTLVRAVGAALGVTNVKSPTFSIEIIYEVHKAHEICQAAKENAPISRLIHADLYRVADADEFSEQFEENLDDGALLMVEWGERWNNAPASDRWDIAISQAGDDLRILEMSAYGERALAVLSRAYSEVLDACR